MADASYTTKNPTLQEAEALWADLERDEFGGYSGINRPFYILGELKRAYQNGREDERALPDTQTSPGHGEPLEIMRELQRVVCRQTKCSGRGFDEKDARCGRCAFCADTAEDVIGTYFKLKAAQSWSSSFLEPADANPLESTAPELRAARLEAALRGLALTASEFLHVTLCDKISDTAAWRKLSGAVTRALEAADAK